MGKFEAVLTPTNFVSHGQALAHLDGQVVFVEGGIPDEEALVEIYAQKKDFCRAIVKEVLRPSPNRITPPCPYFGECGGCHLQHVDYSCQAHMKEKAVADQLRRIGGFENPPIKPIERAANPWNYRNKATFSVNSEGRLGFAKKTSNDVVGVDECMIVHPKINGAVKILQGHVRGLTQIVVRQGFHTEQTLVSPAIRSVSKTIETGQSYFEEKLLGRRFHVSGDAFFQVNTLQAERLAQLVIEGVAPRGNEVLLDVYCGVGTFGVLLAPVVGKVIGIEESRVALHDARVNAQGLTNVAFIQGKAERIMPSLGQRPEVIIIDPPRVGCRPEVIESILKSLAEKVVYVSCDPATLARDLRRLCASGYDLVSVQPVDMFPQTFHIENVAILARR